jgi:hypothetical protein
MPMPNEFDIDDPSDPSAARPLLNPERMLKSQYDLLQRITARTYEIAEREAYYELKQTTDNVEAKTKFRRPNQVFFVDGARGAGKTSAVLTLRLLLDALGKTMQAQIPSKVQALLKDMADQIKKSIEQDVAKRVAAGEQVVVTPANLTNLQTSTLNFVNPHQVSGQKTRRSALVLPIIHPADLEGKQSLLEGVFAVIGKTLKEELAAREKLNDPSSQPVSEIKDLLKRLNNEVASGWYLSRDHGRDAILRDSLNYKQFLELTGDAGEQAHHRVQNWRKFIEDMLDKLGCQTLVVFLDDADNQPSITLDILQTIRVFFDHPRIITILAGNLKQIRQSVVIAEFEGLGEAMQTFRRAAPATEREWRRFARRHAEEFLEKVLPRPSRFYLTIEGSVPDRKNGGTKDEYVTILGSTFDEYSAEQMELYRADYFEGRSLADQRYRQGLVELKDDRHYFSLERFMSWWLLRFNENERDVTWVDRSRSGCSQEASSCYPV